MKTKTLLSIAIIAALPLSANAAQTTVTSQTPVAVGANGTVNVAATSGPYQTATIGEHDDEHIATTAYVKGAYNDAIAAVNKVNSDKQDDLGVSEVIYGQEFDDAINGIIYDDSIDDQTLDSKLVTAAGVAQGLQQLKYYANGLINNLDIDTTVENIYNAIDGGVAEAHAHASEVQTNLNNKRVRIYTTWGTDTVAATTLVPFETAQ